MQFLRSTVRRSHHVVQHRSHGFLAAALVTALVGTSAPLRAQNLVTNGGFDTGDFTGFGISGCTTAPVGYSDAYLVADAAWNPPPHDHYAIFRCQNDSYTILTQWLATTPGQTYDVSFSGSNTSPSGVGNSVRIIFGGTTIFDQSLNTGSFVWQSFTASATASGTSTPFQLEVYNDPAQTFIDDISVTPVQSTVPEPASLALLGTGLAGLAPTLRRRARRS